MGGPVNGLPGSASLFRLLPTCTQSVATHVDLHLAVQAVAEDEVVRQLQAVGLHRVARPVVVVAHVACFFGERRATRWVSVSSDTKKWWTDPAR